VVPLVPLVCLVAMVGDGSLLSAAVVVSLSPNRLLLVGSSRK